MTGNLNDMAAPTGAASAPARSSARPCLADVCGGRDNNLNLLRMIAASAVLVSHSVPIALGGHVPEPLEELTGHSLGWLAVAVFFVISGFLISRSYDRSARLAHWFAARAFRLFPALLVVLLLTVLVLGPAVTALPLVDYFTARGTLTYVPRNLSLAFLQYPLPGVFADNPFPRAINGSLWTLVYEVACYGGVLLAGLAGLFRRRRAFAAVLALYLVGYGLVLAGEPWHGAMARLHVLAKLSFPFALGMAAYAWRERLVLDGRFALLLWALCVPAWFTPLFTQVFIAAIAYASLWLAYVPKGAMLAYNRLGDYSYGVYLYAFPVQQLMAHLVPGQGWAMNIALSLPVTLGCAVVSWHALEKGALAFAKPGGRLWGRNAAGANAGSRA